MKRQLKQCYSTIPTIRTKRSITSHLKFIAKDHIVRITKINIAPTRRNEHIVLQLRDFYQQIHDLSTNRFTRVYSIQHIKHFCTDRHKKHKLCRRPSNDHSWAVWFQLSKWFQRRSVLKHFSHRVQC